MLFGEIPDKNVISFTTMIDGFAKASGVALLGFCLTSCQIRILFLGLL